MENKSRWQEWHQMSLPEQAQVFALVGIGAALFVLSLAVAAMTIVKSIYLLREK